ncbi:disease resistance protein RPS2-like isoform X1 [Panicum miliaceum]|uniref:Disease resistance protein RPS2-like isoform X1 n=1 Tax=Panicum miliaceum TaxID=4540 RepID=A0A3L6PWW5_PANMI|nr:disease resistance protein RPS2-like isoform X1 [Panicum miliaceum]
MIPCSPATSSPPSPMAGAISAGGSCLEAGAPVQMSGKHRHARRGGPGGGRVRSSRPGVACLQAVKTTLRAGVAAEEDKLNVCDPQVQLWLKRVDKLDEVMKLIEEGKGFKKFGFKASSPHLRLLTSYPKLRRLGWRAC